MGATTQDHLDAWIRHQFLEEWDQDMASDWIHAYLDSLDDEEYADALERGWMRVYDDACTKHFRDQEAGAE